MFYLLYAMFINWGSEDSLQRFRKIIFLTIF